MDERNCERALDMPYTTAKDKKASERYRAKGIDFEWFGLILEVSSDYANSRIQEGADPVLWCWFRMSRQYYLIWKTKFYSFFGLARTKESHESTA